MPRRGNLKENQPVNSLQEEIENTAAARFDAWKDRKAALSEAEGDVARNVAARYGARIAVLECYIASLKQIHAQSEDAIRDKIAALQADMQANLRQFCNELGDAGKSLETLRGDSEDAIKLGIKRVYERFPDMVGYARYHVDSWKPVEDSQ
jgi:hypothetical protein